ncbi:TetR/AcrR family transcriptional regulator [Angustibacter speluncae]
MYGPGMTKRLLSPSLAGEPLGVKESASPDDPTADRLLTAGAQAFAERGFHATTTRDIATRAGLSPAGLYVHYPSKQALLARLSLTGHRAALDLVSTALSGPGTPVGRVHRMVEAFVTWHAEHHVVARVVQYELRSLDEATRTEVNAVRRRLEDVVEQAVTEGVADGTMVVDVPRTATRAVLSLAVDVARWFDPRGRESAAEVGRIYADLAVRMLGAAPPTDRSTT